MATRWLVYHSSLTSKGGIATGQSNITQLNTSVQARKARPLSQNVVRKVGDSWNGLKDEAFHMTEKIGGQFG
jgi:hypothetical protein